MGRITGTVLALGIALAGLGGLGGLAALATAQDGESETIAWRTDLKAARVEARESQRPLMVVFR